MEDWQGCLSPACQAALQSARDSVTRRGGYAVTLEDFLLAMLDEIPELCRFLQRQSVDLDELTRTIQCEQPIVTAVASDDLLSSQLVYWFHCARELSDELWLDWPTLLRTLVRSAERLREKAFVAVLELVRHWPFTGAESLDECADEQAPDASVELPVVLADTDWLGLVEDVSVILSAEPRGLIWIRGGRGSGKSSWLKYFLDSQSDTQLNSLPGGAVEVDIRREADILNSNKAAVPAFRNGASIAPTLVLDNISPADLIALMATEFSVARELVTSFPGPILILGPDSSAASAAVPHLQKTLGRDLDCFTMPAAGFSQKLAILTAHQPMIEKRWGVELTAGVVEYVASSGNPLVATPGAMLQWVERAAARLSLFAERGPLVMAALEGQADTIGRQMLLALARQQPVGQFECLQENLSLERAASEVEWYERQREGTLRQLTTEDLRSELERRVAAAGRSGHYIADRRIADRRLTRELKLA